MRTRGSNVANPCTTAATERLIADVSTTSTTGASRSAATSAVEDGAPSAAPSKSPITPSMINTSVSPAARPASGAIASAPHIQGSRLRGEPPVARAW
jgi:hypothetical protein